MLVGCNTRPPAEDGKLEPGLEANVFDTVPSDIEHPTFLDYEGKVHLIGYELEPDGPIKPGSKVKLTMYWHSVSRLGPGWKLFTHLIDGTGNQIANLDAEGPLRGQPQKLPPSAWQPGKVYVDTQEIEIPPKLRLPDVSVAVGIWHQSARRDVQSGARLDVVSGPSDGKGRGIVTHIQTGMPRVLHRKKQTPKTSTKNPKS